MKKAAVFNDLSGFGKCSLTAAIPVLSAQGVQCCPMASAVLTNQTGYEYHKCTDLTAMIKDYIDNWQKNNAHFDGIKKATGINVADAIMEAVAQALADNA